MKKYLLLFMMSILFNKLYAQTDVTHALPLAINNANSQLYKNSNHLVTYSVLADEGCVWCLLNVKNRLQNGLTKVYTAKCEINFLPGFESVAGDNFEAFINPAAIVCDTSRCNNPDIITGTPALVINAVYTNYQWLFKYSADKAVLQNKNYLQQYYFRQALIHQKHFNDIAGNMN